MLIKLVSEAHQLFHIRKSDTVNTNIIVDSAESIIFQYYPPGYKETKGDTAEIQASTSSQKFYGRLEKEKMYGYVGKLLFVDLTTRTWEARDLNENTAKNFVGGPALGAKILYDEMPANTDAFDAQSIVGFVSGPTNGTGPLMGGRYTVVSKSPVTGGWNDANSGGSFGAKLRKSGYDAVFVKGISDEPVYILIDSGEVSIRIAAKLWGLTTEETECAIYEELDDKRVGIALIAPAGERLSNMAAVMNDTHRAAGRGGTGAVMGSKNLKALVCRGNVNIDVFSKEDMLALNKEVVEWEKNGPIAATMVKLFGEQGTGALYESSVLGGDASIKNWGGLPSELTEAEIEALTSAAMDKMYKKKKFACHACSLGCGAIYEIPDGKFPLKETGRPEYETLGMFGSMMLNGDPEIVNWCNFLANEYGYDTISLGATIAWAMECYSNGMFTLEETGDIDLKWGNGEAIVQMTEAICKSSNEMGIILQRGSRAAAEHYNRGFEYLMDADGIEAPQHDPRRAPGLARTYQYDPTPGRHVKGGLGFTHAAEQPPEVKYSFKDTGEADIAGVVDTEITNMAGFCMLSDVGMPPECKSRFLTAVTGFDYSGDEERKLGLRSFAMRHAFNLREGQRRADHKIAGRIVGKPPMQDGPNEGVTIDHEKLADNYYAALGWDIETGVPTRESLEALGGMDNVIADLFGA